MKTLVVMAGLFVATMPAEQPAPRAAQFMQAMNGSIKAMDRDMEKAPMNGIADHDFARVTPLVRSEP